MRSAHTAGTQDTCYSTAKETELLRLLNKEPEFGFLLPVVCQSPMTLTIWSLAALKPTDIMDSQYCFGHFFRGSNIIKCMVLMTLTFVLKQNENNKKKIKLCKWKEVSISGL